MRIAIMLNKKETVTRDMLKWEPGMGMGDEPLDPDPKLREVAERIKRCLGKNFVRRSRHPRDVEAIDLHDANHGYLYTLIGEPL